MRRRTLFFGAGGGGGGTPAAPVRSIQFNNAGTFGGISGATIQGNGAVALVASADNAPALTVAPHSATQTNPLTDVNNGSGYTPQGQSVFRGNGLGTVGGVGFSSPTVVEINTEGAPSFPWALAITARASGKTAGGFFSFAPAGFFNLVCQGTGGNYAGFTFGCDNAGAGAFLFQQDNSVLFLGDGPTTNGVMVAIDPAEKLGFMGTTPVSKQTVAGAKLPGDAVMASLLAALVAYGLITDTTT